MTGQNAMGLGGAFPLTQLETNSDQQSIPSEPGLSAENFFGALCSFRHSARGGSLPRLAILSRRGGGACFSCFRSIGATSAA
jgi:hypothetical protein